MLQRRTKKKKKVFSHSDMSPTPGSPLPDFSLGSQVGPINLHSYLGLSWSLVYAGGLDFDPVSLTELGEMARLNGEFAARKIKVRTWGR